MSANADTLWTLDELGRRVAEALAVDYEGPPNDRVRDVPDQRTIRYYTTLGLIDRPAEMRGRTAYYSPRHLMQLAAIKRLQARGLSLAAVQRELLGISDAALARLARLPASVGQGPAKAGAGAAPRAKPTVPPGLAFWKEAPAPPPTQARATEAGQPMPAQAPVPLQGIRLGEEATLLIATARPIDDNDLEAIRKAAGPLLKLLERRGLIATRPERGDR